MLAVSGLAYEDEAPLRWQRLERLPAGVELQQMNAHNAHLLQADASLEEHRKTLEPNDDNQPLFQELHRLEFKIDMVMRLLGSLLEQQNATPHRRKFRIHAEGVEWVAPSPAPAAGELGVLSVHINRALPYPVEFPCEVMATFAVGEEMAVRAEFRGLSAGVTDLLEKLIFRHHRRQVAESRQSR